MSDIPTHSMRAAAHISDTAHAAVIFIIDTLVVQPTAQFCQPPSDPTAACVSDAAHAAPIAALMAKLVHATCPCTARRFCSHATAASILWAYKFVEEGVLNMMT